MATSDKFGLNADLTIFNDLTLSWNSVQDAVNAATASIKAKLAAMTEDPHGITVADALEMQVLMNRLSQLSEAATAVLQSVDMQVKSLARNAGSGG